MNPLEEVRHVRQGPEPDEKPSGIGLVKFLAACPGNAELVLDRCHEVLEVVLPRQAAAKWPTLSEWRALLPAWFVAQFGREQSEEHAEIEMARLRDLPPEEQAEARKAARWSLGNWIYWFEPENRSWYWWDAMVENPSRIRLACAVKEWPFPWESLRWLFRASGASDFEPEE